MAISKKGVNVLKKMLRNIVNYEGKGYLSQDKRLLAALLYGQLCEIESCKDIIGSVFGNSNKIIYKRPEDADIETINNVLNTSTNNTLKSVLKVLEENDGTNDDTTSK